jgi:hypothetical protein
MLTIEFGGGAEVTRAPLLVPRARLNDARDHHYLGLLGHRDSKHHVHYLVNHRVELVLWNIDAIEATREVYILIAAQHIDLTDEAPQVIGGHPA